MKLIFCPQCEDVFRLIHEDRACRCGKSGGRYTDELRAEIRGSAVPLGFENTSFVRALKKRPKYGCGARFTAFVIPEKCDTISVETSSAKRPHECFTSSFEKQGDSNSAGMSCCRDFFLM